MKTPGVLPYMGYLVMSEPKGQGFSVVLVINRVSMLPILILNRVWFEHFSLELGMFLRRRHLFSNLCSGQPCQLQRS